MAIDEQSRYRLHERLEEILGEAEAATLMEHLPPVGWADVARRSDLDQFEARFDSGLEALEHRIMSNMNEKFVELQRHFILAVVVAMGTLTMSVGGIAFAAAKLFH